MPRTGRVAHPGLGAPSAVLPLAGGGYLVAGREAGNHDHPLTGKRLVVARLRADGSLDPSFGTRGVSSTRLRDGDRSPGQLLLQPNGAIVITQVPFNRGAVQLVGLTPRGGLDRGFGSGGVVAAGVDAPAERAPPPHLPQTVPEGISSAAVRSYQMSAVCRAKRSTTLSRIFRSVSGPRHCAQ